MKKLGIVEQFEQWGEEFNPSEFSLSEEIERFPFTWVDIKGLIAVLNITQDYFVDVFLGGLISRPTLSRGVHGRYGMSIIQKYHILLACKYRMVIIKQGPAKYDRRKVYNLRSQTFIV